uniref:EF-hand domain-containing protein n=1 Tax=Corethron hystrix TaxID=216773 RepID=A0A6U5EIZ5_9STRA|mmetsp:Transcript_17638/g.39948  ORF Transcript_17638/g.39948 Transcript_17638/m.39948 type:complete len:695 (+) Transcript_17638:1878-3962(+)
MQTLFIFNYVYQVMLPSEDIAGLKKILSKVQHCASNKQFSSVSTLDPSTATITPTAAEENGLGVSSDQKITLAGFLSLIKLFVEKYQLETPWNILRMFGYDDGLRLAVDNDHDEAEEEKFGEITGQKELDFAKTRNRFLRQKLFALHLHVKDLAGLPWDLSDGALEFLSATFRQFDSDGDGMLSPKDSESIFSVLCGVPPVPLWHPFRISQSFRGCFSSPRVIHGHMLQSSMVDSDLTASGGTTMLHSTSNRISSVAMHTDNSSLSLVQWIGRWHMCSVLNPLETRVELYRLGYVHNESDGEHIKKVATGYCTNFRKIHRRSTTIPQDSLQQSMRLNQQNCHSALSVGRRAIRVFVFGSHGCGKTTLINYLLGQGRRSVLSSSTTGSSTTVSKASPSLLTETQLPETACSAVFLNDPHPNSQDFSYFHPRKKKEKKNDATSAKKGELLHLIFTEVPSSFFLVSAAAHSKNRADDNHAVALQACDVILLLFDVHDEESLSFVRSLENQAGDVPRLYIGTKYSPSNNANGSDKSSNDEEPLKYDTATQVLHSIREHCTCQGLEPPLLLTTAALHSGGIISIGDGPSGSAAPSPEYVAYCALGHVKGRPHAQRKQREQILWLGFGVFGMGVLVIGTSIVLRRRGRLQLEWLKSWWYSSSTGSNSSSITSAKNSGGSGDGGMDREGRQKVGHPLHLSP